MDIRIVVPDELANKLNERHISSVTMQERMLAALWACVDDSDKALMRRAQEAELQAKFDAETQKIVEILKLANPVKIIRFGSAVRGDLRWKSDLDLCVVLDKPEGTPRFEMSRDLRFLLDKCDYHYEVSLDLHPYKLRRKRSKLICYSTHANFHSRMICLTCEACAKNWMAALAH